MRVKLALELLECDFFLNDFDLVFLMCVDVDNIGHSDDFLRKYDFKIKQLFYCSKNVGTSCIRVCSPLHFNSLSSKKPYGKSLLMLNLIGAYTLTINSVTNFI